MSILLVGLDDDVGPAIIRKLISEDDVVGIIETDVGRGDRWKALGAHVAIGTAMDFDLVERAAQHARSIVIVGGGLEGLADAIDPILTGARLAPGEPARIILVADKTEPEVVQALEASEFDFVILLVGGGGGILRRKPSVSPDEIAEAVNAADDLAGTLRFALDLTNPEDRARLGL